MPNNQDLTLIALKAVAAAPKRIPLQKVLCAFDLNVSAIQVKIALISLVERGLITVLNCPQPTYKATERVRLRRGRNEPNTNQ